MDCPVWLSLSLIVAALSVFWALGFWWYQQGGALLPLIGPSLALLGAAWWFHASASRQERRQKRFIKNAFGRYLHPDWVEHSLLVVIIPAVIDDAVEIEIIGRVINAI